MNRSKLLLIAFVCIFVGLVARFAMKSSRPDLTVMGFVNVRDGIGKQAVDLIRALESDLTINFIATSRVKSGDLDKKMKRFLTKSNKKHKFGKVVILEDMIWTPNRFPAEKLIKADTDAIKIAYSMWESSRLPSEWVLTLNSHFDAVCVPADFLVDVYVSSGVEIPVFVIPLGREFKKFESKPLKQHTQERFVFGNLSACSARKNQLLLIKAFEKVFGNQPDVLLRFNCRYGEEEVIREITQYLAESNLTNVEFTQFNLNPKEYLELFESIDCYVSPSKGEGFSIQPREAMALGIPVICTNNTGQEDICSSGLVYSIETSLVEAALYPWGFYYGKQASCSVDALAQALVDVKAGHKEYLEKASKARQWAMQYDFSNLKDQYQTLVKPERIVLGSENKIEGYSLVTNSKVLYNKYRELGIAKIQESGF